MAGAYFGEVLQDCSRQQSSVSEVLTAAQLFVDSFDTGDLSDDLTESECRRPEDVHMKLMNAVEKEARLGSSVEFVQEVGRTQDNGDFERLLADRWADVALDAPADSVRARLTQDAQFVEFREQIARIGGQESPAAEPDSRVGGDGFAVVMAAVNTVDPISQKTFNDPVQNRHCKHTYDRQTIMAYIHHGRKQKCPYSGCNNKQPLKENDLVTDHAMIKVLRQQNK